MFKRALLIAYFFVLVNWAAVVALYYFLVDERDVWK